MNIRAKHIAILLISMLMQSCYYVDFFDPYEVQEIPVKFTWADEESTPKSMRVILYPADETTRQRIQQGYTIFDMYSSGKNITLPIGMYNAVSFNTDTENMLVDGYEKAENLCVSTINYPLDQSRNYNSLLDSLFNGLPLKYCPNYMVSGTVDSFKVNPSGNEALVIRNSPIVKKVNVEISSIEGLQSLRYVMMSLGPLPCSSKIVNAEESSGNCVLLCDATSNADSLRVSSTFSMFSLNPSMKEKEHRLVLLFWLNEGNIYIPIEIGKLEKYYVPEEDTYNIVIDNLNVDLRDSLNKQDGFDIDVSEWEDENIDISM